MSRRAEIRRPTPPPDPAVLSTGPLTHTSLSLSLTTTTTTTATTPPPPLHPQGDPIAIKVNKLSSAKNLPFEYYSLPYCRPPVVKRARENLGEVLRGDRIETSPFAARFREDVACAPLCRVRLSHKQSMALKARIADEYRVNMVLDNLPVGMARAARGGAPGARAYERGFPVGFKEGERYFLNNHLRFTVLYHEDAAAGAARIVGFEVEPSSVAHAHAGEWDAERPPALTTCGGAPAAGDARQSAADDKEVIFSYDVLFKPSDVRWASRWDTYLASAGGDDQVRGSVCLLVYYLRANLFINLLIYQLFFFIPRSLRPKP